MRILIASDTFKDALSAEAVCEAIASGLRAADDTLEVVQMPLADGGEGTAAILAHHTGGQMVQDRATNPLFQPIMAEFGLSGDGKTAFIEMASASGLQLLKPEERNPLQTSTMGTGALIIAAMSRGAEKIILGLGGSATNDAGMGMAAALGYRFLDEHGQELEPVGGSLSKVDRIDDSMLLFDPRNIEIITLCDVDNPLFGEEGAAHIFAPQKGADQAAVEQLDAGLRNIAPKMEALAGKAVAAIPGSGAAGGMGAGCLTYLGATLRPGIETIMDVAGFGAALDQADLVITGEGRLDEQTLRGKLISGITTRARQKGVPVVALCGALQAAPGAIRSIGLQAAFSIQNRPVSLETALKETAERLEDTAFHVAQLIVAKL
ncbi:MAG: glycerate kinase [Phaeodactylibacter sp.]|uniref:glycerate kinase n=1 Tax=Phaeodactylibacter sp. TaxID=1940289 RepID=UPI0032EDC19B